MGSPPFQILYEDNHLLAVDKPAGVLTQPTDLNNSSLETLLKAWIKERDHKPGNVFLGVIHRLDKPVSGIVIFAKTSKALSRLNAAMRERQMHKTYCALVEGRPAQEEAILEHYLKQDDYRAHIVGKSDCEAKLARLHYKTLEKFPDATLLQVKLETGRYHQIRAQMNAIGCPIVGDGKYGSKRMLGDGMIALHHTGLQFEHPVTGVAVCIESNIPKYITGI